MQYDIFISYRRSDTGDKAEHLKDLLEKEYQELAKKITLHSFCAVI